MLYIFIFWTIINDAFASKNLIHVNYTKHRMDLRCGSSLLLELLEAIKKPSKISKGLASKGNTWET